MPHDGRSSISTGIHIGAAALSVIAHDHAGLAAARALIGIANHRIMDDFAAYDRSGGPMVSAELGAEARIGDVLIGQDEIDSVGVVGQVLVLDGILDDGLNGAIATKALSQRIVVMVVVGCGVVHGIQDVLAGAVAIGGGDLFLRRATQMLEVVVDNVLVFGGPAAVPDDADGGGFLEHRAAIVVDVARITVAIRKRVGLLAIGPQSVGSVVLSESGARKTHHHHQT